MHSRIAVTVGDIEIAVRRNGQVGRIVKGRPSTQDGSEVHAGGASVGRLTTLPQLPDELAFWRVFPNGMIVVVRAIDGIIRTDGKAMRIGEASFAPGTQEHAVPVKYHDRMFATIEDIDTIFAVRSHTGNLGPGP